MLTSSMLCFFFFFKQKTAYELRISDWSSDVCSSDLLELPDLDGLEVCRAIRSMSHVPVIIVTARESELDCVLSLQAGADDYVEIGRASYRERVCQYV